MAEQHFPSMIDELRRRLAAGGRFHAPQVFDVTEKQAEQLAGELLLTREWHLLPSAEIAALLKDGKINLWGVPVRIVP